MAVLADLRDEVYVRINTKKLASGFSNNSFSLIRTWRPRMALETLTQSHPNGVVYVVGGEFGDRITVSRSKAAKAEFSVKIGFQSVIPDLEDMDAIDDLTGFVDELESCIRHDVNASLYEFVRTEFEKDESGLPFDFINFDQIATFEAYFRVYFATVLT